VEHLNGGFSKAAKANSPYTSFGSNGVIDKYGGKEIKVDLDGLRDAISRNEVKGVTVIEHSQVLQAIEEETNIPKGIRTMLRNFAVADKEILVKGVIPKRFVQVKAD